MYKNFLASTLLASSILGSSSLAFAGKLGYTSAQGLTPYSFTITSSTTNPLLNGTPYNSTILLGAAIAPSVKLGESFKFDQASDTNLQNDLLAQATTPNAQPLVADVANGIATLTKTNFNQSQLSGILQTASDLKSFGLDPFEEFDFTDLFGLNSSSLQKILQASNAFQEFVGVAEQVIDLVENNPVIVNTLVQQNNTVVINAQAVINQNKVAVKNNTATTAQKIAYYEAIFEVFEEFEEIAESTNIINTAQAQENLKDGLDAAQEIQNLNPNSDNLPTIVNLLKGYIANATQVNNSTLPAVQKSDAHTTSGIMQASLVNTGILNERVGGFIGNTGVASGDAFETFGAWIQGNFGVGQQKAFKKEPGYKFNQRGVTIGVDTGDESLIGVAFSYFMTDVNNKTASSAKDKITSYIGSIYGMSVLSPEFFISGQFSYGASTIKKSRNTADLANNKATAKPKGTTIGGRAEVGYVYAFNNSTQIVPTIGFAVNQVDVKGYTEKGNGLNRTVGKRTSSRNSGLAGLTLRHVADMESMKVMPEIHANIDYAFSGKNSATNISLGNGLINTTTPSEKISKMYFNLGTSVKLAGINSNMIDVTAGYDLGLAKKFISHTGALKLRVNF